MTGRRVMPPARNFAVLTIIRRDLGASRGPCDNLANHFHQSKHDKACVLLLTDQGGGGKRR
jgi:hypothetical protein